uniref:RING-type domain-containing protein n=1 Tax=Anser cygnoides TaxID=8845 RepID=A0A8B9DMP5_ANSCY
DVGAQPRPPTGEMLRELSPLCQTPWTPQPCRAAPTCPCSPAGSHHLSVHVTGTSLMARLLRSTIGSLNTSSDTELETSNFACLPQPRGMTRQQYVDSCLPLAVLVLLCLLQVYMYRLRRAIAAFYFPKREKSRVLYLYNKLLRQRQCFVRLQRKRIARRARRYPALWCCRRWPRLRRWVRWPCTVCGEPKSPRDHQACPSPACGASYCRPCWRDVGRVCPACTPGDHGLSEDSRRPAPCNKCCAFPPPRGEW